MLGIDLYKEVLLNGEQYEGKVYISEDKTIYYVDVCVNTYAIFKKGENCSVINMESHEDGCLGIDNFMLTELNELNQEVEMSWQECLVKYIENPEKYYMKAIDEHKMIHIFENYATLKGEFDCGISFEFIKTAKWFLCER